MLCVHCPASSCSTTASRAPGMRSTGPCASVPERTASTAASVPSSNKVAAAGPVKAARPVREIQRKMTPTMSSTMAKWTMMGWDVARLGMAAIYPSPCIALLRPRRVPDDVVHRPLHELRSLVAPPLRLGAHFGEPPLDVGHLEGAELVLDIEVLRDQRLDPRTDGGAHGFGNGGPIGALLGAGVGLEPEHAGHELRAHGVAPHQVLKHVELHGQARDFHPVRVRRGGLERG